MIKALFKHMVFGLAAVFAQAVSAHAQPADLPSAETLFEAANQAHGWQALKTDLGTIEAHADVTVADRAYKTVVRGKVSAQALGDATFILIRNNGTSQYSETGGNGRLCARPSVPPARDVSGA